jgi:hypothetical protein
VGAEMSIEAMKQMVHELEYVLDCINNDEIPFDGDDFHEALRLGRQAIEEAEKQESDDLTIAYMSGFHDGKNKDAPQPKPEQEPVAWMDEYGDVLSASVVDGSGLRNIPLYTTPPQRNSEQEPVTLKVNGIPPFKNPPNDVIDAAFHVSDWAHRNN